ncbi:MAG: sporulation protein YtfJ [Clostridiales bacterium]|nr:sporulation protein YtfJ [Clostridiales bacterium]
MSEHSFSGMIESIMDNLNQMTDVTTIIGEPIMAPSGVTIIPVSKVTVGFGLGGGDFKGNPAGSVEKDPFGGGGGGALTISPVAFLTISGENVKLITIDRKETTADKALAMAPEMIDKVLRAIKKDPSGDHDEPLY